MRIIAVLVFLVFCHSVSSRGEAADRVALVIGNNAYSGTAALANPVRDATAISAALEELGFSVLLATDIDRRKAIAAIDEFGRRLTDHATALVYYAGHAVQIGGRNFLLPTDVSVDSERALRYSSIDIQEVVAEMERRAGVSIVILDSCRDNPFLDQLPDRGATRSAQAQRGLGPMQLRGRGAIIAYAAAAGAVASDGDGEHSPYTAALLEEIGAPGVEVGLMFRRVAKRVIDATRGQQRPELLVRLVDEVYLNPGDGETVMAALPAAPALDTVQPADDASEGEAGSPETIVALNSRQAVAPGRVASSDKRFFGTRVIHIPSWTSELTVPEPSGWRSAVPIEMSETDGNNSFSTAQPIPLASVVEGRITPRGDSDWFQIAVPSAGELRVDVDPAPDELDLHAQVWNADHGVAAGWQSSAGAGRSLSARFALPEEGEYRIQLTDGGSNAESSTAFATRIDFVAADDPFEPNNSFGSAAPLPTTAAFAPTIYPRGDNDWFKLWVAEPGLLRLTAFDVPDELDVHMQVLDLNAKVVRRWIGPDRKGGDTVLDAELPAPGTYLIQVSDGGNNAATVEPFQLSVDVHPVSDGDEPNNSYSEAVIVPATGGRKIAIFPRGDHDWLAVDVDHPGELSLLVTNSPDDLDIHLRVMNADAQNVLGWTGPARQGGDVDAIADLATPGRYFINITDGGDNASSPDLFDLELAYIAQPDQHEPNNGPADAAPLTPGGQILFNILPRGDHDWFRIKVPSAGELAIVVEEVAENLDIHYRVLDADQKPVVNWTGPPRAGAVTEGFADLPRPGAYYLQFTDGGDNARSIEHATLSTTFAPIAETVEPNNSFSRATALKIGEPHLATILPRGDQDWYLVEAPRSGTFVVTVEEVDDNLDIHVRLLDAEAKPSRWFGPPRAGAVTEAEIAVPAAGLYRLQVTDGGGNARSPKPFRILVDFR